MSKDYAKLIKDERERQNQLPGSEYDINNTVNDWISIAGYYISESTQRRGNEEYSRSQVSKEDFENSLIKAAAVILAALEHSDILLKKGNLK